MFRIPGIVIMWCATCILGLILMPLLGVSAGIHVTFSGRSLACAQDPGVAGWPPHPDDIVHISRSIPASPGTTLSLYRVPQGMKFVLTDLYTVARGPITLRENHDIKLQPPFLGAFGNAPAFRSSIGVPFGPGTAVNLVIEAGTGEQTVSYALSGYLVDISS